MKTSKSKKVSADEVMETITSMRKKDREELLGKLLDLEEFRQDRHDAELIEKRKNEKHRPFKDYLKERGVRS